MLTLLLACVRCVCSFVPQQLPADHLPAVAKQLNDALSAKSPVYLPARARDGSLCTVVRPEKVSRCIASAGLAWCALLSGYPLLQE